LPIIEKPSLEIETVDFGAVNISTVKDEETIQKFVESPATAETQPSPGK